MWLICAVCIGDPASPLTQSANGGVVFLLAVISSVLIGFGSLFVYWAHRAKRATFLPDPSK
jgi:hypothetical protein